MKHLLNNAGWREFIIIAGFVGTILGSFYYNQQQMLAQMDSKYVTKERFSDLCLKLDNIDARTENIYKILIGKGGITNGSR